MFRGREAEHCRCSLLPAQRSHYPHIQVREKGERNEDLKRIHLQPQKEFVYFFSFYWCIILIDNLIYIYLSLSTLFISAFKFFSFALIVYFSLGFMFNTFKNIEVFLRQKVEWKISWKWKNYENYLKLHYTEHIRHTSVRVNLELQCVWNF